MSQRSRDAEYVLVPVEALTAIHASLTRELGGTRAAFVLREIGLESSAAMYERFRDFLSVRDPSAPSPEELSGPDFWARLSDFFKDLGWGRVEHEHIRPGVFSLSVVNWAEVRALRESGAGCHLTAGLLAGLLHHVAGQDVAILEVERSADAGSARFLVGSPETLDAVFGRMREGAAYPEALEAVA